MLSSAKQVIPAVAWFRLTTPTRRPASSGPKLVMIRPLPLQKDTAVARTCVGDSSGRYTAGADKTPKTKNPNTNRRYGDGADDANAKDRYRPISIAPNLYVRILSRR